MLQRTTSDDSISEICQQKVLIEHYANGILVGYVPNQEVEKETKDMFYEELKEVPALKEYWFFNALVNVMQFN